MEATAITGEGVVTTAGALGHSAATCANVSKLNCRTIQHSCYCGRNVNSLERSFLQTQQCAIWKTLLYTHCIQQFPKFWAQKEGRDVFEKKEKAKQPRSQSSSGRLWSSDEKKAEACDVAAAVGLGTPQFTQGSGYDTYSCAVCPQSSRWVNLEWATKVLPSYACHIAANIEGNHRLIASFLLAQKANCENWQVNPWQKQMCFFCSLQLRKWSPLLGHVWTGRLQQRFPSRSLRRTWCWGQSSLFLSVREK